MKCACPGGPGICGYWSSDAGCRHPGVKEITAERTAEAEALVDALTDPLRKVLRGEMDFMEAMPLIGAASRKIIAALTGGGA